MTGKVSVRGIGLPQFTASDGARSLSAESWAAWRSMTTNLSFCGMAHAVRTCVIGGSGCHKRGDGGSIGLFRRDRMNTG
jgi:hypothetical protein